MPMRLLERLRCAELPMNIDEDVDIEKCRVLRDAQLIQADIPPLLNERGGAKYAGHATVMCVTAIGIEVSRARARAPEHSAGDFPPSARPVARYELRKAAK